MAYGKTARQRSTYISLASSAVDNDLNTAACNYNNEVNPWWSVDLGQIYNVRRVVITSPTTSLTIYCNYIVSLINSESGVFYKNLSMAYFVISTLPN